MLSWSLQPVLNSLKTKSNHEVTIAASCTQLSLTASQPSALHSSTECPISINPYILKTYFSKYQHSFFLEGERVTEQTFFVSSEFPSVILGTTLGRIFIV